MAFGMHGGGAASADWCHEAWRVCSSAGPLLTLASASFQTQQRSHWPGLRGRCLMMTHVAPRRCRAAVGDGTGSRGHGGAVAEAPATARAVEAGLALQ